jgi:L-ascorbate metabolism protein UlaG (beta-lactamase superfamily)
MLVRWFGQSAYLLDGSTRVFIDPFGDMSPRLAARGFRFDYPPIEGVSADLLLVTHEHADHNAVEVIGGSPQTIRMLAGTHETAIGNVIGVSSEHDAVAGTQRGQNTIYCFTLDGTRFCHLGDLGQESLRPEQRAAIGDVDVLFVPAGGGPTISAENAAALVRELAPRVTIPMHYGNESVDFVEPPDAFLDALGAEVDRLDASSVDVQHLRAGVTLLAAPSPRS